jgi:hypothetical protein
LFHDILCDLWGMDIKMTSTVEKVLILPIIMIVLLVLTMIFLNALSPYIYYTKISDVSRQYIASIEESGGLTSVEKEKLLSDLEKRGIPRGQVVITSSPALDTNIPYGNPVSITITFNYMKDDILASTNGVSMSFKNNKKLVPIVVGKTGISRFLE